MTRPAISVVMPVKNAVSTLAEAADSVLMSRGVELELIVVDHGSVDASMRVVPDSRAVRNVFVSGDKPFADALNAGVAACRADVVARMDADDRMHPDRLRADLAALALEPDLDVVACRVEPFPAEDTSDNMRMYVRWQNAQLTPEDHAREIWIEQPLCHPAATFRRRALEDVGGYRAGDFPEDYDLFLRLVARGGRVRKRPAVHHGWRQHGDMSTRNDPRYSRDALARAKAAALLERFELFQRPVFIAGAGKEGRRIGRALAEHKVAAVRWFDVAADKIGRVRRGAPVVPADTLAVERARHEGVFLIGAVGTSGARGAVRAALHEAGFVEGEDAVVVA